MEYLTNLTNTSKEVYFSLRIYDCLREANNAADKWFVMTFVDRPPHTVQSDLDLKTKETVSFHLSQGMWLLNIALSLGLHKISSRPYLENSYNDFMKNGFKSLVTDERYNYNEDRPYTDDEVNEQEQMARKIAVEFMRNVGK